MSQTQAQSSNGNQATQLAGHVTLTSIAELGETQAAASWKTESVGDW